MSEKRPALGKGLSALIPDVPDAPRHGVLEVDIDLLQPNEQQPRLQMDDVRLEELARSVAANGIIQPILVRRTGATYRIIAGERRWRAAQRAQLLKVPVVVREMPADNADQHLLELALIENIQRENLNPVEEAVAYQRLSDEFSMTQDQIAAAVGKDRSSVANYVRLLRLPDEVRAELAAGTLAMGHARALLALPDEAAQRRAARDVIAGRLSVRETEALVKKLTAGEATGEASARVATPQKNDVHTRAAEDKMRHVLGTRVRIVRRGAKGTLRIDFTSEDELNRLYEFITERH
ncbi:MAG: ParB/RepB/Spo0J family partition protein [Vicinamibacterales bacterium]